MAKKKIDTRITESQHRQFTPEQIMMKEPALSDALCIWQTATDCLTTFHRSIIVRNQVSQTLKKLGFSYVTMDLDGYRTGSMNETLNV